MAKLLLSLFFFIAFLYCSAQADSSRPRPLKISHAEPLYADIIRDLGARKGEKEYNVGWEVSDKGGYIGQGGFVEYEFSPINRLGLEVEIPFNYRYTGKDLNTEPLPREKIEGVKLASQYTFLVSARHRLSVAAGAIYELGLHSFHTMSSSRHVLKGHDINPFIIVAKRLGRNFHSMLYTGPVFHCEPGTHKDAASIQVNLSLHYVLPGSGNFIGIETNQELRAHTYALMIRPQVKIKLDRQNSLGLATGIPVDARKEGLNFPVRYIFEPK